MVTRNVKSIASCSLRDIQQDMFVASTCGSLELTHTTHEQALHHLATDTTHEGTRDITRMAHDNRPIQRDGYT